MKCNLFIAPRSNTLHYRFFPPLHGESRSNGTICNSRPYKGSGFQRMPVVFRLKYFETGPWWPPDLQGERIQYKASIRDPFWTNPGFSPKICSDQKNNR